MAVGRQALAQHLFGGHPQAGHCAAGLLAFGDMQQGQLGLVLRGQLGGAAQGDICFMAEVVSDQDMSEQSKTLH